MISLNLVKGTGLEDIAARDFHLEDHILHLSQIAFCHHQQETHDYNERERGKGVVYLMLSIKNTNTTAGKTTGNIFFPYQLCWISPLQT